MSQTTTARAHFARIDEAPAWTNSSGTTYTPTGGSYPMAPAPVRDANRAAVRQAARRVQSLNQCTTCFQTRSRSGACDC